jgi:hypothetical protein
MINRKQCALALVAIAAAGMLGFGTAEAHKVRTCPDGSQTSDSRACPKKKLIYGNSAQAQAHKPTKSVYAERWTVYRPNPPSPRPKP